MSGIHISITDKTYSVEGVKRQAIAPLELQIGRNEFVCLVGPSGCGKTTLLNIVAGLDKDFQGRISTHDTQSTPHIGYVFQNPRLLPWLTVRQNLELVFTSPPPADVLNSLLAEMQLEGVQDAYPERLSLGMQRRVSIIRAFAINPDILLMDEPFVSLDAPSARQIRSLLYGLWLQRPHTVLFVTHDLREAIALADRLIFLSAAPMQMVADITVEIPRIQRHDAAQIEAFREYLLGSFPAIRQLI